MLKKFSTLIEYITWLYKHNLQLQRSSGNIFRIINTEKNKDGECLVTIQVINKASTFRCTANEIITQDQLLECFSKSDIRLLTYLATEYLLKPKNKIVGFEYNTQTEQTILQIKKNGSDQLTKLTADKISNNAELLKNFSQEDAHRIGYLFATEQIMLEKKAIAKTK